LSGYLGDKLGILPAEMTMEAAASALRGRGVPAEAIREIAECSERAEFVRFAPGADSRETRKDLLDAAGRAITSIEKSLQGRQ